MPQTEGQAREESPEDKPETSEAPQTSAESTSEETGETGESADGEEEGQAAREEEEEQAQPPKEQTAPAKKESFRERMRRYGRFLREYYFPMDPRTIGLFRLLHGFLLTADCIRHWKEARWFYSNAGVLTNHYHLYAPSSDYNFSIYHAFSSLPEVHVAFAISTFVYFCYFIGWHARLFSILSFVLVTSMDNRLVMVENGGYVVVNLVTLYAMFLPTDRRFSVDALLRSLRERKERTLDQLNERVQPARELDPYISGVVFLAVVNFAIVYFFNVVNKSGRIWRAGETVHYVLYLNRMVTGLAVFFREILPYPITKALTFAVLAVEGVLVPLMLSPYARRYTRPFAMLGVAMIHTAFGIMFRLGPFSWFMICWSFWLPVSENWQDITAWYKRRAFHRIVIIDDKNPLAFAIARLLARLDLLELLQFEAHSPDAKTPADLLAVRDPKSGEIFRNGAAIREILQALPAGKYIRPFFAVFTLGLAGPLLQWASSRRGQLSRFFGLSIPPRGTEQAEPIPSPLGEKWGRARRFLRESLVAYLAVCFFWQTLAENKNVPAIRGEQKIPEQFRANWDKLGKTLHLPLPALPERYSFPQRIQSLVEQPSFIVATIQYPRLFQGWGMFAPNPITEDGVVAIDGYTLDGRRVDPFTGKEPDLVLTDSKGEGLNQIWQDYFNRIRMDRNKKFRKPLRDYLLNWHGETGRPGDELVAFDVYWVTDKCPRIGEKEPYDNKTIAILSYRKPGYKAPPGHPVIPPPPKEESAGN